MKTESEAYGCWCPLVRHYAAPGSGFHTNRGDGVHQPPYIQSGCIGATCMAWRWEMEFDPADKPADGSVTAFVLRARAPTNRGYCGLAGKPEVT
jgi:hypothetical protein